MTRIIGRLTSIGLGKEATRGTIVAPTYWVPVRALDFDDKTEVKANESGFGNINAVQDASIVRQWSDGSFEGKVFDQSEGVILRALFGAAPSSVQRTTTGVYDHTFAMANTNQHTSLTVGIKEANNDLRYALAMIDSYSLEATMDDYVHRTVNLISKKSATASNTVAYTNENEFLPKHLIIKFAAAGANDATIDGASSIKARMIRADIAKNAEALSILGSNDPDDVANKQLEITGTLEMYYDDTTYKALFLAGTHQALRIDIVSDVIIGTSGTHTPALRLQFPEIVFTNWQRAFDNNDVMIQTIEFRAVLNLAAGSSITGRLTNAYAGTNYA